MIDHQRPTSPFAVIDELLDNWARYVRWGSDGLAHHDELCGSVERMFAFDLSRFQWGGEDPRPVQPRMQDGAIIERIVTDLERFPTVWRSVIVTEFIRFRYRPETVPPDRFVQFKARMARVGPRMYRESLDLARRYIQAEFFRVKAHGNLADV